MRQQQFQQLTQQFQGMDQRFTLQFEQVNQRFEAIIHKLLEHDIRFEKIESNMATKSDIRRIDATLDKVIKKIKDLKQESASYLSWLKRHDADLAIIKAAVV